ncbi:MAG TPA: DUF459 domain-containing protein [Acidisphaera sp.]|nr:DUF459 domain-containing protein [Acidisphaera sp.]HME27260.1 DUF459 domain-containing protein [Acetobacteraceae bacterium]
MTELTRRRIGRRPVLLGGLAAISAALVSRPARAATSTELQPDALAPDVHRILVIGDSQAQGLAGGFMRLFRRRPDIRIIDKSKIATGLMPRPNYDWPAETPKLAASEHADVAVVMFGANDRPLVRTHGEIDPAKRAAFVADYGAKVNAIVSALRAAGMPVVWVGHPNARDPVFSQDMKLLDEIYESAATQAGADYVSCWQLFADPSGNYTAFGPGTDGETTRLRADDGVHLTPAGYDLLARDIIPHLHGPQPQIGPTATRP